MNLIIGNVNDMTKKSINSDFILGILKLWLQLLPFELQG